MKYVFPRQFKLHNVFTSKVDARETVQPFKDYTLREQELLQRQNRVTKKASSPRNAEQHLPRRLRGDVVGLIRSMQRRNLHCSHGKLVKYYCPVDNKVLKCWGESQPNSRVKSRKMRSGRSYAPELSGEETRKGGETLAEDTTSKESEIQHFGRASGSSLVDMASSYAQVSAFCRASMSSLIPRAFWGEGETALHNENLFMGNIDRFVRMRRFESMSLHTCFQHIQVCRDAVSLYLVHRDALGLLLSSFTLFLGYR